MKGVEKGIKDTPIEIPKWINDNKIKYIITTDYKTGYVKIETDDVRWLEKLKLENNMTDIDPELK